MLPASIYATQALHGIVYAMLLFLVASGLSLVFGMMRILNLAHAGFYMLGAYLAYSTYAISGSFWLALLVVPALMALAGGLIERFLLRRTQALGHAYELLLTFGLFFMIGQCALWIWGDAPLEVPVPSLLQGGIDWFGGRYPLYRLFILATGLVICAGMFLVLHRTRIGIIIRSAVSDGAMVSALGINTDLVRIGVFAAGAALAAFAGAIAAPFLQAEPNMGLTILADCFVVIVLGGFGSLGGALIAALAIGQLQSFGVLFMPELAGMFQFLLMAAVLIIRPQGLFGEAS